MIPTFFLGMFHDLWVSKQKLFLCKQRNDFQKQKYWAARSWQSWKHMKLGSWSPGFESCLVRKVNSPIKILTVFWIFKISLLKLFSFNYFLSGGRSDKLNPRIKLIFERKEVFDFITKDPKVFRAIFWFRVSKTFLKNLKFKSVEILDFFFVFCNGGEFFLRTSAVSFGIIRIGNRTFKILGGGAIAEVSKAPCEAIICHKTLIPDFYC